MLYSNASLAGPSTNPSSRRAFGAMLLAVLLAVLWGCTPPLATDRIDSHHDQVDIREASEALSRYRSLLLAHDSDGIARLFVPDGSLEHVGQPPIVGRERIRAFLASFSKYRVLSHEMEVQSTSTSPARVVQVGTYDQHVLTPAGQEVTAKGWFRFQWQRQHDGVWLIERGQTSSAPIVGDISE